MTDDKISPPRKKTKGTLDWFVKKSKNTEAGSSQLPSQPPCPPTTQAGQDFTSLSNNTPQTQKGNATYASRERQNQLDVKSLPHDPAKRRRILDYHPMDHEAVRKEYIQRGACQPKKHKFPKTDFGGGTLRRFNPFWFKKYTWLEYSVSKDAAYCFYCYLFRNETTKAASGDAFVVNGFTSWNKPIRLKKHIGRVNSAHNQAFQKFENLKNPKSSIQVCLSQQSEQAKSEYEIRLTASVQCLRFLLRQGLAFRGHDECENSSNKGNFLELLNWFSEKNDDVGNVVLKNAPKNNKMIAPSIQKQLINCCAKETIKAIVEDLGKDYFGILVDESSDASQKEQMALCVRYIDKKGMIMERFLGIVHVGDTTAMSLKEAIYSLLNEHSLSLSRVRGQGYDGASNMKGEINGLKTLIMNETPSAFYIHCFAHQLQLTLVAVSKKSKDCGWLFDTLGDLLNVVGVSCKRKDMLRGKQVEKVAKAFEDGEIESGRGLNQELGLGRPGDTRWGSHYKLILNVIALYPAIREVLDLIGDDARNSDDARKADNASFAIESFDFIFIIHLMKKIFGIVNELNTVLQKKDQDIVNAMSLVTLTKKRLQDMRENEWESFLTTTTSFCNKNGINVLDMNDVYTPPGRKKRGRLDTSNSHHFRIEVFLGVIDLQLQELNNRFDEVSMELLTCMACLSPLDTFSSFDKQKLLRLAEFYPDEFSNVELLSLDDQFDNYIADMRRDDRFWGLKDLGELSMKLVETDKYQVYQQVYLLIKLVLILPVATASVERAFSSMNIVKNRLRNSMGDQFLNDCLVTYIERDIFLQVSDDDIMKRFQRMKNRREQL